MTTTAQIGTVSEATAALAAIDAALDVLQGLEFVDSDDRVAADFLKTTFLKTLSRQESQLASVKLKALAAAETSGTARRAGAATTDAWAADLLKVDGAPMARQVKLAARLVRSAATQDALAAGRITAEKAAIIVEAGSRLPPGLTFAERERVEARLLIQAPQVTPKRLRQVARRALEAIRPREVVDAHENEQLEREEEAAYSRARLTLHDNADGTVTGHFTVPTVAGGILKKVVDAMCAPRRQAMREAAVELDGTTDWAHLRGLAFVELLEHLPVGHLHTTVASTVVVTIDHGALTGVLRAAGSDLDAMISAGDARRIACGAGLLPAVLDGRSVPIDLGQKRRLFSESQRVALAARHRTCAAEGCERPYAWCELHHRRPWSRGGPSDLDNAIPLCGWHHRQIHKHPERVEVRRT